jgi:hypothetical protein
MAIAQVDHQQLHTNLHCGHKAAPGAACETGLGRLQGHFEPPLQSALYLEPWQLRRQALLTLVALQGQGSHVCAVLALCAVSGCVRDD